MSDPITIHIPEGTPAGVVMRHLLALADAIDASFKIDPDGSLRLRPNDGRKRRAVQTLPGQAPLLPQDQS